MKELDRKDTPEVTGGTIYDPPGYPMPEYPKYPGIPMPKEIYEPEDGTSDPTAY